MRDNVNNVATQTTLDLVSHPVQGAEIIEEYLPALRSALTRFFELNASIVLPEDWTADLHMTALTAAVDYVETTSRMPRWAVDYSLRERTRACESLVFDALLKQHRILCGDTEPAIDIQIVEQL